MKLKIFLILILFINISCKKNQENRTRLGKDFAQKELEKSLSDTSLHNVIESNSEIIKDEETASYIAEKIMFKIYGQKNIENQRPYETYKLKNYWVISGTLPSENVGGTFFIILDARDSRIIRLTHGK